MAVKPLERAIAAHPDYAPARGVLARLHFAVHMGWIDRDRAMLPGRQHAIRAIALDDRHHWGHIAPGYRALMERRTEESIAAFRRAVNHYAAGRYEQAIERSLEAQRLRRGFQGSRRLLCVSLAQAGRIDEARSLLVTIRARAVEPLGRVDQSERSLPDT